MNKLKNKFVPYKLAVKLKDLGFDEPCLGGFDYLTEGKEPEFKLLLFSVNKDDKYYEKRKQIPTPLWEDAFDWFRDKFNLDSYVRKITYREWQLEINYILQNDSEEEFKKSKKFIDFKGNQKDARITCLEKLIEIVEKHWKIV